MSGYVDSVDLVPNLPQTCFCKSKPTPANGGSIKYDGRRLYFELDPRTQVAIESVLGERVLSTYPATPLFRNWIAPFLPELGGFYDPKTGVYGHPLGIPPRVKAAWRESCRPKGRFDFRDFLNSVDEMNLRYDDPTPEQREKNQADDSEAFLRLNANKPWYVGAGFTRVRPDGEFDERGRFVFEVLVLKGHLDEAKRDLPTYSGVHKFRGFPIVFRESWPIVALKDRGLGSVFVCDEIKGLSREEIEKISSGSSISVSQLTPGDPGADRQKLLDIAREAQAREARSAKISAAIAIGSVAIAVIGLYINYRRSQKAV